MFTEIRETIISDPMQSDIYGAIICQTVDVNLQQQVRLQ